jgi:hypothetical protein
MNENEKSRKKVFRGRAEDECMEYIRRKASNNY